MPKEESVVLVTVPNKLMSALRAYWTTMDLDRGPRATHFWDLRYGAVNRWKSDDSWPPHIHYTLMFRRGDNLDDIEHVEKHGAFPSDPKTWKIVFSKGTFPESFNTEFDEWITRNRKKISEIEEKKGPKEGWAYVEKHGPPQYLPNPENWTPEQAAKELNETIPKAIELFESERLPIDWKPKGFIL
jgi:hypothetical protein